MANGRGDDIEWMGSSNECNSRHLLVALILLFHQPCQKKETKSNPLACAEALSTSTILRKNIFFFSGLNILFFGNYDIKLMGIVQVFSRDDYDGTAEAQNCNF